MIEVQQGDTYPEAEPGTPSNVGGVRNEEDIAQPNQPACTYMCDELFGPDGSKRTQSCVGQLLAEPRPTIIQRSIIECLPRRG